MFKHIFAVVTVIHQAAVLSKQVEECMEGTVDNFNIHIIPEHLLLNPGL